MADKLDYQIKVDGEYHEFEGGAVRYTKTGKGRVDLIPICTLCKLTKDIETRCADNNVQTHELSNLLENYNEKDYLGCIRTLFAKFYVLPEMVGAENSQIVMNCDTIALYAKMILDIAIHFEKGAAKYGEHNCEKGIPLYSFEQSALRHTLQSYSGATDENHVAAAIWNWFMAQWTLDKMYDEASIANDLDDLEDIEDFGL